MNSPVPPLAVTSIDGRFLQTPIDHLPHKKQHNRVQQPKRCPLQSETHILRKFPWKTKPASGKNNLPGE
jgi:hypothetical protein